jgi:putative transcriptional regulator
MRRNGRLVRLKPDGAEEALSTPSLAPMSAAEIEAGAARDRENPPLTDARAGQLRPVPRVKTLRRALALTQEEFAARYHIPLATLRDWEQGRSVPDQPTKAFLTVIARDPKGVERVLQSVPGYLAEAAKIRGMKSETAEPDPELYFVLVRAPDDQALSSREYQEELWKFDRSLRSQGVEVSPRRYAYDSIGGGGGLSGEFGVIAPALGPAVCAALGTALGAFLSGRHRRKVRLQIGQDRKFEAEAQTVDEIKELLKLAAKYQKQTARR